MGCELTQTVEAVLNQAPSYQRLWLGFSGGMDSHVLLHCLRHHPTLQVIHIDHGLQPQAVEWAQHCQQVCTVYQVPYSLIKVQVNCQAGESLEAKAREARYKAFKQVLRTGDMLLTAHHQDDQVETFFLQLFRGTGSTGLAAMPVYKSLGKAIVHCRPCLTIPRQRLLQYAEMHQLTWIEDPSNSDPHFRRNFLRHQVLPLVKQQWPGLGKVIIEHAHLQQQTLELLQELAQQDYLKFAHPTAKNRLKCTGLLDLTPAHLANLLRYWIKINGFPIPNKKRLSSITEVIAAKQDAQGEVSWQGICLRRYQRELYLLTPSKGLPQHSMILWHCANPYPLIGGKLLQCHSPGLFVEPIRIAYRQGGERFYKNHSVGSHPLKKYFQAWGIPPWERDQLPLLYYCDQLIAIPPYAQAHPKVFADLGIELPEKEITLFSIITSK